MSHDEIKEKYDGLIFDLDGTLWDATEVILESWNEVLKKRKDIKRLAITKTELSNCMGLTMYNIASELFPKETEVVQKSLMDEMCDNELKLLSAKGGRLYDGVPETLKQLAKKYKLFIVSNCQEGYIEAFIKSHNMEGIFTDTECWGRTGLSKGESNKILIRRNKINNAVYIGDTVGDAQSAADSEIDFIYAEYGFGNIDNSHFRITESINSFKKLKDILL